MPPPQLVLNHTFDDMGEYGEQVGWDLAFRQLDAGPLAADARLLVAPGMASIQVSFNRGLHQEGMAPDGAWTFGLPDPVCDEFRWCGAQARGGDVLNFNGSAGFDGVSASGFRGHTLSFPDPLVRERLRVLGIHPRLLARFRRTGHWSTPEGLTTSLRRSLDQLHRTPNLTHHQKISAASLFHTGALDPLLLALAGDQLKPRVLDPQGRVQLVRDALALVHESETTPISVSDWCLALGVSAPTLYRAFREQLGMGPKRYLLLHRLNGVRAELRREHDGRKVHQIAGRWGFWHMGQFSSDYRRLFGESPSHTLRSR